MNNRPSGYPFPAGRRRAPLLLAWIFGLSCCLTLQAQIGLEQILFDPADDLPANFVSEVDLVFVYEAALLNQLPYTQFDWISSRSDYLDGTVSGLEVVTHLITADTTPVLYTLNEAQRGAQAALLFASHADPVAEVIDLSHDIRIRLRIEPYGINVLTE